MPNWTKICSLVASLLDTLLILKMNLSKLISCKHCGNIAKMEIVGCVIDDNDDYDPNDGSGGYWGTHYNVLRCPACEKINIVSYKWHDGMNSEDEINYDFLYPQNSSNPIGLPEKILKAYEAAEKVKTIDVNAYAILMRRLLELVCLDRGASSEYLAVMLKELADKNEIPQKLVKVASGLKDFGNIGAHAGSGELTEKEIPIVNALCIAILEYVYTAPHLATIAENKLNSIKTKTKSKKIMATRTVFTDDKNNKMDCHQNDQGKVFISVGQTGDSIMHNSFIRLEKNDVTQLIKTLSELEKKMLD